MKVQDVQALASGAVSANPTRPATMVVHDTPDVRIVLFRIDPGQRVAQHTSPSHVILSILTGSGIVSGAEGDRDVKAGDLVSYEPREPHGMRATDERLVIMAVIAPRPGATGLSQTQATS